MYINKRDQILYICFDFKGDNMNRDRAYYRKQRKKVIKKRLRLYKSKESFRSIQDIVQGKLSRGNSGYLSLGKNKKTNSKKGHASYRHKGAYGKNMQYKKHDQTQLDDMKIQIDEYINEHSSEIGVV